MLDFLITFFQYKYHYFIDIPIVGIFLATILKNIQKHSANVVVSVLSKIVFFLPKTIYYFIVQFATILALHSTSAKYKELAYKDIFEKVNEYKNKKEQTNINTHDIIETYQGQEKELLSFFNYILKKITWSICFFLIGSFFTVAIYHYYGIIKDKKDALNYVRIHYMGHKDSINTIESHSSIPTTREVDSKIMSIITSFILLDGQWQDFLKSEKELDYPKLDVFFKVIKIIKNKNTNGLDYYQITFVGDIDQDGTRISQIFLNNAPSAYKIYNKNLFIEGQENFVCDFKIIQKIDMQSNIEKNNTIVHEFIKDDILKDCKMEYDDLKSQIYKILSSHTRASQLSLYVGLNEVVCNNVQIRYIISLNFNERLYSKYKEHQKPYAKARDALKFISDRIQKDTLNVDYCNSARNGDNF